MKRPANAAAEEIARLTSINNDIDEQVRVLRESQGRNGTIIEQLGPLAEWVEVTDPTGPSLPEGVVTDV